MREGSYAVTGINSLGAMSGDGFSSMSELAESYVLHDPYHSISREDIVSGVRSTLDDDARAIHDSLRSIWQRFSREYAADFGCNKTTVYHCSSSVVGNVPVDFNAKIIFGKFSPDDNKNLDMIFETSERYFYLGAYNNIDVLYLHLRVKPRFLNLFLRIPELDFSYGLNENFVKLGTGARDGLFDGRTSLTMKSFLSGLDKYSDDKRFAFNPRCLVDCICNLEEMLDNKDVL